MKKSILAIAMLLISAAGINASAQEFEYTGAARPNFNEISVSYGYITLPYIGVLMGDILGSVIVSPLSNEKLGNVSSTGAIGLEYMRYLASGRASFGAMVAYEGLNTVFVDKNDASKVRKENEHAITLMPSAKVVWFNRKGFGMYSRAGVGVTMMMLPKSVNFMAAVQINPVGMDFGGSRVRGFIEAGFGTQGVVNAGIKACF